MQLTNVRFNFLLLLSQKRRLGRWQECCKSMLSYCTRRGWRQGMKQGLTRRQKCVSNRHSTIPTVYATARKEAPKSACSSIEQLGRYERGEMLPKIETAAFLARAYRCEEILTKRVDLAKEKAASGAGTPKADM